MALSTNRITYGIHSLCPFSRVDNLPFGILKVLGGGSISLSSEFEDLFGGSNKFAWASEAKTITSEFTATVKSMPDFLFELYLGATVTTTAADALGTVTSALANVLGTSVLSATVGIASATIEAGSEADLKAGIYVVKAVSPTTVDVYCLTDIDFSEGTDLTYVDDSLKITATPLTIADTSAVVSIPDIGIELTSGSGTIAMTSLDTAMFSVAKAHNGISEISIGSSATTFPEHGLVLLSQKRSNGDLFEIECHKAVGAGFPIALEETVFAIPELTIKLLYDEEKNEVFKIRAMKG